MLVKKQHREHQRQVRHWTSLFQKNKKNINNKKTLVVLVFPTQDNAVLQLVKGSWSELMERCLVLNQDNPGRKPVTGLGVEVDPSAG